MSSVAITQDARRQEPTAVYALLVANIALFVADKVLRLGAVSKLYLYHTGWAWWQPLSATFCHASRAHLSGNAFLLLLQCLTGDGWSSVMADAMKDEASGKCSMAEGNCGSAAAIPFFISFQVIGSFVFLNLVVAVILENFSTLHTLKPDLVSSSGFRGIDEAVLRRARCANSSKVSWPSASVSTSSKRRSLS